MTAQPSPPRLTLAHATLAVSDLDTMLAFYCDVLGFRVTNRGEPGDGTELVFISQDPNNHHQIVMVAGLQPADHAFVLVDHFAFRTGTLDDLRSIQANLDHAGIEGVIPISHGNAWSLYFNDPEGNGLECFVDSPFHVAQPYGGPLDLASSDDAIESATRADIEEKPEFRPMQQWQDEFTSALGLGD